MKGRITPRLVAVVGCLTRMYSTMDCQIVASRKGLLALVAAIGCVTRVLALVVRQFVPVGEGFWALGTLVWFFTRMCPQMSC